MKVITNKINFNNKVINGLTKELNVFCIIEYFDSHDENVIVLTNSLYESNIYYELLSTYSEDVCLFPMDDFLTSVAVAVSPDLRLKRLETIDKIGTEKKIVITNLMGFLKYLPNINYVDKMKYQINVGNSINRDNFINMLDSFGYKRESMVTMTGEYAIRGFVIDIFNINNEHPIRIEFFGDEIEAIRYFDENTQLSISPVDNLVIKPIEELNTDEFSSLFDYMREPFVFKINSDMIETGFNKLIEDIFNYNVSEGIDVNHKYMFSLDEFNINRSIALNNFGNDSYSCKEIDNFNGDFALVNEFFKKNILLNKTCVLCLDNNTQLKNINEYIDNCIFTDENNLFKDKVNVIKKNSNKGFIFEDYVIVSVNDLENSTKRIVNYKNTLKIGKKIKDFNNLNIGDYVVHTLHGIGVYSGIVTLSKGEIKKDYVQINYKDDDKIYIPVEKIDSIYKYSSKDGAKPVINQLNSTIWLKKRNALRKKINDISKELIELYAARMRVVSDKYIDNEMELDFANDFIYHETNDQLKVIKEINNDLKSQVPMDRLLCGDVGFGKTEVAFRGIFKTIVNDKQVFYLCPTTILSLQQYKSAVERFKNFPIEIALLNRFTTPKETKRILEGLANGTIDLVFGTHRLLSNDVKFKRLGMLVVDEEQRFGVTHKEKIKIFKNDVNVLTLSATPIPRTLKMAMSGLRDLSVIDTAPINRYPIQTYVVAESDALIKDSIYKELSRDGQVFVLYNRVESIQNMTEKLKRLIPDARFRFAHGRMSKVELDDVMNTFTNHEFDVLVSTTIIETGIDIANANTLLVIDADYFGLSQLYQLRGRVGRSDRIAYAYLFYKKSKTLNDIAVKRLQSIKEFTELGSGYKIAMRDLSIRGGGDILGSEQAGFVDTVGLELYMKMVEEEMARLRGEEVEEEDTSNTTLLDVDTHISNSYVSDENLKIEIHNKINSINDFDSMNDLITEFEDRFGKLPESLVIYMYEEILEKLCKRLGINKINKTGLEVSFELDENISNRVKGDKLFMVAYSISNKFKFKYNNKRINISLSLNGLDKHFILYLIDILKEIEYQVTQSI